MTDVEIYRANRRVLDITVEDPPGTAISVEGWSATFSLRTNVLGAENLLHFTDEDVESQIEVGATDTDGLACRVLITLIEEDTNLPPGWYVWDVLVTDPNSGAYTIVAGALRILAALSGPDLP